MNDRQAVAEYLNWLGGFVCPPSIRDRYKSLFSVLAERSFTPKVFHDDNREADGLELREKFADEYLYGRVSFWEGLLPEECLVLEMLVSLSLRMEWDFMHDDELGDRTGIWFWEMLRNIGLDEMDDLNFDERYVQMRISILVDREYERNGEGGLFPLRRPPRGVDMSSVELWYQMNWYISEKIRYGQ